MGYGVRMMTKCTYNIHHNIIGASIMGGIDNSRFCKDEYIKIDNNIMFGNKGGDLYYTPASNTKLQLTVDQFEDLEFESVSGNFGEAPEIGVNQAYMKGSSVQGIRRPPIMIPIRLKISGQGNSSHINNYSYSHS